MFVREMGNDMRNIVEQSQLIKPVRIITINTPGVRNPMSEKVIRLMQEIAGADEASDVLRQMEFRIYGDFATPSCAEPDTLVLFDGVCKGPFTPVPPPGVIPSWGRQCQAVLISGSITPVGERNAANNILADFVVNFDKRLTEGGRARPWGLAKVRVGAHRGGSASRKSYVGPHGSKTPNKLPLPYASGQNNHSS